MPLRRDPFSTTCAAVRQPTNHVNRDSFKVRIGSNRVSFEYSCMRVALRLLASGSFRTDLLPHGPNCKSGTVEGETMTPATRYIRTAQTAAEGTAVWDDGPHFAGATIVARVSWRERAPCVLTKSTPSRHHRVSGLWLVSTPAQTVAPAESEDLNVYSSPSPFSLTGIDRLRAAPSQQ